MALDPNVRLTNDEVKVVQSAARRVWDYVAGDYFELTEGKPVSRAEVVEVVCDADRLEGELRRMGHTLIADKVARYDTTIYKVVKPAFPFARYAL